MENVDKKKMLKIMMTGLSQRLSERFSGNFVGGVTGMDRSEKRNNYGVHYNSIY